KISQLVCQAGADVGIAFDGDADRVVLADAAGNLVDGDGILYLLSQQRHARGETGGVVGTQMTNLGVEIACREAGVPFVRANVGDRFVLQELLQREWTLGGETSGHILCLERSTTGDGLVAALAVLEVMVSTKTSLAALVQDLVVFPQCMINVRVDGVEPAGMLEDASVQDIVGICEKQLGERGRVVLRSSGTEPVIRVMVEGDCAKTVESLARKIADTVELAGLNKGA
ncbi:MAG TPA: phosphoglucosamine mutase, partial [Arenicellales bacterium]|nr:phosphoglucosamine mutase [Arenicellales bacterium]